MDDLQQRGELAQCRAAASRARGDAPHLPCLMLKNVGIVREHDNLGYGVLLEGIRPQKSTRAKGLTLCAESSSFSSICGHDEPMA